MADKSTQKQPKQQESPELGSQHNDVVTLVLTADNHLGFSTFGQQPQRREERQQRLRRAFQQATDFAIVQGVDLFVQGGDLFDASNPDEQDRSFVAERLAQLKQAGVRTIALGGVHDTPLTEATPAPQMSFARLGALHYCSPIPKQGEPLPAEIIDVHGVRVGIAGIGVLAGQVGDPLANLRVSVNIEGAAVPILLLHAPIEGLVTGSSLLDTRACVSQESISNLSMFKYILAGYHHGHTRQRINQTELVVAGATQHVDFTSPKQEPGFVFMGIAADGIRWCNHISSLDALQCKRLIIQTSELWPEGSDGVDGDAPALSRTELILERLRPLCSEDTMLQVRLEGQISRRQYHELDLNQIRRYGEEHCFTLAIDDSLLTLLPEAEVYPVEGTERLSLFSEMRTLTDEWIAKTTDEQEKKALQYTKEELLQAMDEVKR
ncbi:metallophosphoesterase family protein [Ktedonospora formicarum]|uniref:Nuclease n=1 Tax=Ktedonospora formicarum TaxID=2778364 RepID=A0A8J3HYE9_9CHLR|nr:metallophosphoesterase [Ktedonospora formicarum]GHO44251.1 nuclease [Ktedonospora formicarum]